MKAKKIISQLEKFIEKYGDIDVSMLCFICNTNGDILGETIQPIRQIKYRKKFNKLICDNIGGF